MRDAWILLPSASRRRRVLCRREVSFANSDRSVLPGLFVRVRVPALEKKNALLVPGDAVSFDQQGEYVLVVNDKNVVERRGVKTGSQVGGMLVIGEGLKPDDRVIVEGILQAIPGRAVKPQQAEKLSLACRKQQELPSEALSKKSRRVVDDTGFASWRDNSAACPFN